MLKRFLCLVITFLLVTGTAFCEGAYQANITFELSPEGASLAAAEMAADEAQRDSLAKALADLTESLEIKLNMQEAGARLAVMLKESSLLDFTVFSTETEGYVLSNLLPAHYVYAAVSQEEADAAAAAFDKMCKTDWMSVLNELSDTLAARLETTYANQEIGNFMGDAYEGGARRLTFSFADSDVAAFVNDCLTMLAAHGIDDALLHQWLGVDGLLSGLMAHNNEISAVNRYNYTLYIVLNEENAPIGMSLLTMEADELVMTLSLGFGDNGWHAVWGYGLNQENIYIDFVLIDGAIASEKDFSLTVYRDPYREGFRAVEPYLDYMQMLYSGTIGFAQKDAGVSWYADVECYAAGSETPDKWCRVDGECSFQTETADQTINWYLSEDGQPSETICITFGPCEPMVLDVSGMEALNVDDASFDADLTDLMTEAAGDLMIELFKTVPAPLLTYFMQ